MNFIGGIKAKQDFCTVRIFDHWPHETEEKQNVSWYVSGQISKESFCVWWLSWPSCCARLLADGSLAE